MTFFIGYDYYGAGNIGDDLMMSGFLEIVSRTCRQEIRLIAVTPHDVTSQRARFPRIDWYSENETSREALMAQADAWIGVGDTPFQLSGGTWFLERLQRAVAICETAGVPMYMVGAGAESDIRTRSEAFGRVAQRMRHISTRDEASAAIIRGLIGGAEVSLSAGADLANLSLPTIYESLPFSEHAYDLGVTINTGDHFSSADARTVAGEIKARHSHASIFICNETRKWRQLDQGVFSRFFARRWWRGGSSIVLHVPDYHGDSLSELVDVYRRCRTVISSRYHGLLSAAWAGCRVVALARNSKVAQLAACMDIPCVDRPVRKDDLRAAIAEAHTVPRELLESFRAHAADSNGRVIGQAISECGTP
jgi:polysaccharide pyruvyl transferase WcaK-like protein